MPNPHTDAGWSLLQVQMAVRTFVRAVQREQLDEHPTDSKLAEATQDAAKALETLLKARGDVPTNDACTFDLGSRFSGAPIVWVYKENGDCFIIDQDGTIDPNC